MLPWYHIASFMIVTHVCMFQTPRTTDLTSQSLRGYPQIFPRIQRQLVSSEMQRTYKRVKRSSFQLKVF